MHQEAVGADCPFANGLQHLPGFRFLSREADRVRCLKRDGGVEFVALDRQDAEDRYKLEPVDALTPAVREEIGRTVASPAEIDAEIHELCAALMLPKDGSSHENKLPK
jgi:hypothetical protein